MESGRASRLPAEFRIQYTETTVSGDGILRNLSRTGAWIESSAPKPELGKTVEVVVRVGPEHDVRLDGTVSRTTSEGFALALTRVSEEVLELLDLLG